jgi:hypothetical protein
VRHQAGITAPVSRSLQRDNARRQLMTYRPCDMDDHRHVNT